MASFWADIARQPVARGVTDPDFAPNGLSNLLVGVHVAQKTETVVGYRIDKYIHIGVGTRVVLRIRTKQVKRAHAVRSQGGFGFLQSRNDVVAMHDVTLSQQASLGQFAPARCIPRQGG